MDLHNCEPMHTYTTVFVRTYLCRRASASKRERRTVVIEGDDRLKKRIDQGVSLLSPIDSRQLDKKTKFGLLR